MSSPIVISSHCNRLHITMENEQCSMVISKDLKSLIFDSKSSDPFSSIEITLINDEGCEIISSLITRLKSGDVSETIRIDGILQLIFSSDEQMEITSERGGEQFMSIAVFVVGCPRSTPIYEESTTPIQSADLIIDNTTLVPVSKELLALYSPYFETIFYQEFAEKQNGIYEVKEVDVTNFQLFIEYLHERNKDKRKFSTVEQAIVALEYIDRFGITVIHEQAFSFLKTQTLSRESLKEMFIVCSRFKNHYHMIDWILNQYKLEDELLDLIHDCVPFVPAKVIQSALKALRLIGNRSKEAMEKLRKEAREEYQLNKAIIHLRCYNEIGGMESERYFKLGLDTSKDFHWVRHLWPEIPSQYSVAEIDGERNGRDNGVWFKVKAPKIVEVEAYKH